MKVFIDCEMTGLHQHTTLISLALVAENGRSFYAESVDYDKYQLTPWLRANVLDNLFLKKDPKNVVNYTGDVRGPEYTVCGHNVFIGAAVQEWLAGFSHVEVWGDVLIYDWMLFCELFPIPENHDTTERLPKNIYYIPFDIATLMKAKGVDPDCNREAFANGGLEIERPKHNALHDARVIKACYERLMEPQQGSRP